MQVKKIIENYRNKTYKFLRWSEKWTKTDMIYLTKGGFWLTLGQIFSSISGLLLAIAFAHLIPQEIYGNYKYILSLVGILSALSLSGIGVSITQNVARGFEGSLEQGFWENLRWGILVILASLGGFIYYFLNENHTIAYSLLIAGATYPILQSSSFYGSFLGGKREFKASTIIGIFRSIIPAFLIFITIIFTQNLLIIITVYSLSHALTALFFYFYTIKKFKPNNKIDERNIHFGKHLSLMGALGTVANNLESILIFHFFGGAQLAVYTFATALPKQFNFLKKAIQTMALPKLSQKSIPELKKIIPAKVTMLFFALIPAVGAFILSAPYIYKIFFPQYLDSVIYSQVLSLYILLFPSLFYTQALIAHAKKSYLYVTGVTLPIIQIISLIILLPVYGIWGAVFSTLILRLSNFIISLFLFNRM